MTESTDARSVPGDAPARADVDAALAVAVRAPSIHNTQPWRWQLGPTGLTLRADRERQLAVADPDGHSLLISCGAALHLTDLALRAQGWDVEVTVLPDATDPDALALFQVGNRHEPDADVLALVDAALRRRSDRRPFAGEPVPESAVETLRAATHDSYAWLDVPRDEGQRIDLAVAVSWADRVQQHDEAYVAEMTRWLRDPQVHSSADGVPLEAIPHVTAGHPRRSDVPLRDFEAGVPGRELIEQDVDEKPLIAVIFTESDSHREQLEAGRAMMRLMLAAELAGLVSCPLSQAVDLASFRSRVQGLMGWIGYPQMMLRVGYPSGPQDELGRTPRRGPDAVLDVIG